MHTNGRWSLNLRGTHLRDGNRPALRILDSAISHQELHQEVQLSASHLAIDSTDIHNGYLLTTARVSLRIFGKSLLLATASSTL